MTKEIQITNTKYKNRKGARPLFVQGFTLIEILVAMAILVIVIGSTLAIFRASAISWQKGEIRVMRYQQARFILERMSREISSIVPVSLAGPYCLGMPDKFYFICSVSQTPAAVIEVGYWLDEDSGELMRSYESSPDYDFSSFDEEEALSENISGLSFEYSDGDAWQENWDSRPDAVRGGMLPKAVKVSLDIRDEKGTNSESFSTVVTVASAQE